jgi:uncharacterized membrane protein YkoI
MTTRNLLVTALVATGLVVSSAAWAWAAEEMSELVEMNSLPEAVQKTIKDKATGGEIVGVKGEDDKNGKWNYEATIKKEGKEWCVEVAPDGKFVKKHQEKAKE